MRGSRSSIVLVALVALVTACSAEEAEPRSAPRVTSTPTEAVEQPDPDTGAEQDQLDRFLARARIFRRGVAGPNHELRRVDHTSPTDAAAEILVESEDGAGQQTVIVTTDDNWAHAAGISISWDLADYVSYVPMGHGAVAIKAEDQAKPNGSYPPFVLHADGTVTLLRVLRQRRALDADDVLVANSYFGHDIGLPSFMLGADVGASEVFRLPPRPPEVNGLTYQHVPGREGMVNVSGYERQVGEGVWRFSVSTDKARTWRTTDVPFRPTDPWARQRCVLPGQCGVYPYGDDFSVALGPGRRQAVALTDQPEDYPHRLHQLWVTSDEEAFDLVAPPWGGMPVNGMAYADDGALLVAEAQMPSDGCDGLDTCRAGRLWRLRPDGTELEPLADAPRLSGYGLLGGMYDAGGVIVAHTGARTVAVSRDGYSWREVTPGGRP